MNPAFGVALIPSLYGYAAHTTYHCAEAAYVSIPLRIITPLYIPIEGWRPCQGSQLCVACSGHSAVWPHSEQLKQCSQTGYCPSNSARLQ